MKQPQGESLWLKELLYLHHLPGLGPRTFAQLLQQFNTIDQLFSASRAQLQASGLGAHLAKQIHQPDWTIITPSQQFAQGEQAQIIHYYHPNYPDSLQQLDDAPLILYLKGQAQLLKAPQLALVGTRKPSPLGQQTGYDFAKALSKQGLVITSGLALGIDAACHEGALAAGGPTIAVCPTGLNHCYPSRHQALAQRIIEQGCLVSEFTPDTTIKANRFAQRNRLIAGLSLGTLVIEAARKSGALMTARYALGYNREVFAIPGSIHHPLAKGPHELIKQGAKLVEHLDDILLELTGSLPSTYQRSETVSSASQDNSLPDNYKAVLYCVGFAATPLDVIVAKTQQTPAAVLPLLLDLVLKRHIVTVPGGYMRAIRGDNERKSA